MSLPPRRGLPLLKFLPGLGHENPCTPVYPYSRCPLPLLPVSRGVLYPSSRCPGIWFSFPEGVVMSFFFNALWNPCKKAFLTPKTLRKPSPKPSQNASQIASYVPTPEMFKNGTTMVRKPHFGSLLAFRNRLKIDAKTPSKSALSWIPSWNPKKYDFRC